MLLFRHTRRREFIGLVGGAAALWPLAARAQPRAIPVIGFLHAGSPHPYTRLVAMFRQGLGETGYVEGQNVTVEYHWAQGRYNRLPELAADLVARRVAVIFAGGGLVSALAAKAATAIIPIVFNIGGDPVKFGLVASLSRPGGNITGVNFFAVELGSKRLGLLHELVPDSRKLAFLVNPNNSAIQYAGDVKEVQDAARTLGLQVLVLEAGTEPDLNAAFAKLVEQRVGALIVNGDSFFIDLRDLLVALAARHAVPTLLFEREFAVTGGLMSYGANITDAYRQVGVGWRAAGG